VKAVEGAGGRTKGGAETVKIRSTGADHGVGLVGSCREIGNFVRIMVNLLKRENTHSFHFAKKICWEILAAVIEKGG